MEEICEFITRRFSKDCDWTTGNCYYFALILISRFPWLNLIYDQVEGHFMAGEYTKDSLVCYDQKNVTIYDYNSKEIKYLWDFNDMKEKDPLLYKRLIKDCVL